MDHRMKCQFSGNGKRIGSRLSFEIPFNLAETMLFLPPPNRKVIYLSASPKLLRKCICNSRVAQQNFEIASQSLASCFKGLILAAGADFGLVFPEFVRWCSDWKIVAVERRVRRRLMPLNEAGRSGSSFSFLEPAKPESISYDLAHPIRAASG